MKYQEHNRSLKFMTIEPSKQDDILRLAANGTPIAQIEKLCDISWETIARFAIKDPLFAKKWTENRSIGADKIADQLLTVYDEAQTVADAMIARGRSENIRTIVGWRNPARYGPKLNVEVSHTIDLTKALEQADTRLFGALNNTVQEIPPVEKVAPALHYMSSFEEREKIREMAEMGAERYKSEIIDAVEVPKRAEPKAITLPNEEPINDPGASGYYGDKVGCLNTATGIGPDINTVSKDYDYGLELGEDTETVSEEGEDFEGLL